MKPREKPSDMFEHLEELLLTHFTALLKHLGKIKVHKNLIFKRGNY